MNLMDIFSNREIATGIWALAAIIAALCIAPIRKSLRGLLKAFFNAKVLSLVCIFAFCSSAVVLILKYFGFWNISLLKDTVLWFLFIGLVSSFRQVTSETKEGLFKTTVLDNIKAIAIIEFLLDTYTFSLPVEMVLLPVVSFIAIIDAVARLDKEHVSLRKVTSALLILFGLIVITSSIVKAIYDSVHLLTFDTLKAFLLAPVLSILLSPFVFLMFTYVSYESEFVRIGHLLRENMELARYTKRKIATSFGFRGLGTPPPEAVVMS